MSASDLMGSLTEVLAKLRDGVVLEQERDAVRRQVGELKAEFDQLTATHAALALEVRGLQDVKSNLDQSIAEAKIEISKLKRRLFGAAA
jgi:hypothetical protein